MHRTLGLCLLLAATGACGNDTTTNPGQPDASVTTTPDGNPADGTPVFDVTSSDIVINPGQEVTYCYYFHTPNTETVGIRKWTSDLTPGSHHMILFLDSGGGTPPPDGTVDENCGFGNGTSVPVWVYAAQTEHAEAVLPADDGTGKPIGMDLAPGTAAFYQMHYLNATDQPLTAHVNVKGYAIPKGTAYTNTAAYVTYNGNISIGPGATNVTASQTCPIPAGVQFWTMSTHSHKQSIGTAVKDGSTIVFQSQDWEHPGSQDWTAAPFFSFSSGQLTYECTYNNIGDNASRTVTDGSSAQTDEMCMAIGYFFPATKSRICYNNYLLP